MRKPNKRGEGQDGARAERADTSGGAGATSATAPDLVIFLHGRGLGPETGRPLADAFRGAELSAPVGGVALRRGSTWFENRRVGIARPASVAAAERRFLEWREAEGLADRPTWLSGFSNGGAFAAHLLIRHPGLFLGAALFCAPMVLPPWPLEALKGKNVFYGHGDARDETVGPEFYRSAEEYLQQRSGSEIMIRQYRAGHEITPEMVSDVGIWFDRVRVDAGGQSR